MNLSTIRLKIMVLERWGVLLLKENILVKKKDIFLENVELDVYADDQKIIDRQDFI